MMKKDKIVYGGVFDKDLYKIQLNDPRILDSQKGWKLKKKESTMFPNSWDKAKIREKILEAAGNAKLRQDPQKLKISKKIGYTKDGIPLEFRIDGETPSIFPNFSYPVKK